MLKNRKEFKYSYTHIYIKVKEHLQTNAKIGKLSLFRVRCHRLLLSGKGGINYNSRFITLIEKQNMLLNSKTLEYECFKISCFYIELCKSIINFMLQNMI